MDDIRHLHDEAAKTPMTGVWTKGGPVFSHLTEPTVLGFEAQGIATFGNASTLGLWAFATGIWTTGLFQTGLLPQRDMNLLFPEMLIYAGIVLLIAGLFVYRRNDTFHGSSFCSFAALNITRAVLMMLQNRGVLPNDGTATVLEGCLLESFAYVALSLFAGALRMNAVAALVWACAFVGYLLAGLPYVANGAAAGGWAAAGRIGGYFLFAAGFFAYYGGTALLVNTTWRRAVLPLGGKA
ncbi:MAG TPA: GPR1/FUN34/YaaH family transporter [Stellaceae bacterium]|nr:GPR1/FUN34/YaaH family transporter [Stellaceae bacterium]